MPFLVVGSLPATHSSRIPSISPTCTAMATSSEKALAGSSCVSILTSLLRTTRASKV